MSDCIGSCMTLSRTGHIALYSDLLLRLLPHRQPCLHEIQDSKHYLTKTTLAH